MLEHVDHTDRVHRLRDKRRDILGLAGEYAHPGVVASGLRAECLARLYAADVFALPFEYSEQVPRAAADVEHAVSADKAREERV